MKSNHTPRYAQTKTMIILVDFRGVLGDTPIRSSLRPNQKPDPPISDQVFYPTSTHKKLVGG